MKQMCVHARLGARAGGAVTVIGAVLALSVSNVDAQSAEELEAASAAYGRGTQAYLRGDHAEAAQWFETAHGIAPSVEALTEAVRNYYMAEELLRAGTLALQLDELYPNDELAHETVTRILPQVRASLVEVLVICEGCAVRVEQSLAEYPRFFVAPGVEHHITAEFANGSVESTVVGRQGQLREIRIATPEGPPIGDEERIVLPDATEDDVRLDDVDDEGGIGVVPVWLTMVSAGLAVASGSLLIWSGVETLDGVDAYEANPTIEGLREGQEKEDRTNVLIGVTAGLAALTTGLLIFTDWDLGSEESEPSGERVQVGFRGSVASWELHVQGQFL